MRFLDELIVRMTTAKPQKGQGLVEYGLIIVLVAIAAAVGLGVMGPQLSGLFSGLMARLGLPGA
jgi:pilus assembly protein Flp/PilA